MEIHSAEQHDAFFALKSSTAELTAAAERHTWDDL